MSAAETIVRFWLGLDPDAMDDEDFSARVLEAMWMEERYFSRMALAVNQGFVGNGS